jgi:hypothetical protein
MSVWNGLDENMSRTDLAVEIQALRADVRSAAAENVGLRARVAELETAGDRVADELVNTLGYESESYEAWTTAARGER